MKALESLMRNGFLLLTMVQFSSLCFGQQNDSCVINLKVIDALSGSPIANIGIADNTGNLIKRTDEKGYAKMMVSASSAYLIAQTLQKDTMLLAGNFCNETIVRYLIQEQISGEIEVTGLAEHKRLLETSGAIGYIDQRLLGITDRTSIQAAINTIPGVYMDSRGYGGSHKLNIRGSALRAPFAVRNIKIYLDGIALTSPDGQSPLELLDASEMQSIEVIKGPAGSIYGSGNGGVLLVKSQFARPAEHSVKVSTQIGSNLLLRTQEDIRIGFKKGGIRISHVLQDNKGFRRQEFNHKNQLNVIGRHYLGERNTLTYIGSYYNGRWGLPGALTAKEATENPTLSNAFSWLNNAHVWRERAMIGLAHQWHGARGITSRSSISGYVTNKLNPYGTSAFNSGYKTEQATGSTMRTEWKIPHFREGKLTMETVAGFEFQHENYSILEQKIFQGKPTEKKYNYDVNYLSSMIFLSEEIKLGNRIALQGGVSANKMLQQTEGSAGASFLFDTIATWRTALLPRVAAHLNPIKNQYIFISYSVGNSNPTIFEMINADNYTYNLHLKPEKGRNSEVGIKGHFDKLKLEYEISLYRFLLSNAILPYQLALTDSSGQVDNITLYKNYGTTRQEGLECSIRKQIVQEERLKITSFLNGNFTRYVYKRYDTGNPEKLNNNRIPGNPANTISGGVDINYASRWHLGGLYMWNDRIPLNDQNSVWSKPYHLVNLQMSYELNTPSYLMKMYSGINNLLNTSYTSFFNLNAVNNRFYNPYQGVNYYIGLEVQLKKPAKSRAARHNRV